MGGRKAGTWARRRAKQRRSELLRTRWQQLLLVFGVVVAVGVVAVTFAAVVVGAWMGWFIAGAFYGATSLLWIVMFELIDPVDIDGVRVVHGSDLAALLTELDPVLAREQVVQIRDRLEPVAQRLAVHQANRPVAFAHR